MPDKATISRYVGQFLEDFERRFEAVDLTEKKEMLRKVVERIRVNPEKKEVTCYFRKIPAIDELQNLNETGSFLLGAKCSPNGNRTRISALRGLRPKPLDDGAAV